MSWDNFFYDMQESMSLYPDATKLLQKLDNSFLSFINTETVYHVKIPSLISEDVLRKCGYFSTFPQHLTFLTPFLSSENGLRYSRKFLTPAACIHIYPMLKREREINACYTTKERVYRYENGEFEHPERLWEFTVREMVFVGSTKYVLSKLTLIKNKALSFAKTIDTNAELRSACDLFYPSKENNVQRRLQLANHAKDELLLSLDGRKIAVASFNYHGSHFSKAFDFDEQGNIVTGCIGFGLERRILCCYSNSNYNAIKNN